MLIHAPGDATFPQVSEGTSQVPAALMACESSLLMETKDPLGSKVA